MGNRMLAQYQSTPRHVLSCHARNWCSGLRHCPVAVDRSVQRLECKLKWVQTRLLCFLIQEHGDKSMAVSCSPSLHRSYCISQSLLFPRYSVHRAFLLRSLCHRTIISIVFWFPGGQWSLVTHSRNGDHHDHLPDINVSIYGFCICILISWGLRRGWSIPGL